MVNKSTKDLFEMLKKPEDYKHLMPESLVSFETTENGFKFGLKGMPEIALKISEIGRGQESGAYIRKSFLGFRSDRADGCSFRK